MNTVEHMLKALANKRRLTILSYLKKHDEASVGDIASTIKLSFTSTSKHLTILSRAGLVERTQKHLYAYYRIPHTIPQFVTKLLSEI